MPIIPHSQIKASIPDETTLIGTGNGSDMKVRILLSLLKIPYKRLELNATTKEVFEFNPRGRIPVYIHKGVVFAESIDILIELVKQANQVDLWLPRKNDKIMDLLNLATTAEEPYNLVMLAMVYEAKGLIKRSVTQLFFRKKLFIFRAMGGDFHQRSLDIAYSQRVIHDIENTVLDNENSVLSDQRLIQSVKDLRSILQTIESCLNENNGDYILGKQISLVDIAYYWCCRSSLNLFELKADYPLINRWVTTMMKLPSVEKNTKDFPRVLIFMFRISSYLRGRPATKILQSTTP